MSMSPTRANASAMAAERSSGARSECAVLRLQATRQPSPVPRGRQPPIGTRYSSPSSPEIASSSSSAAAWAGVTRTSPPRSSSCGKKLAWTVTSSPPASSSTMIARPGPLPLASSSPPSAAPAAESTVTARSCQCERASLRSASVIWSRWWRLRSVSAVTAAAMGASARRSSGEGTYPVWRARLRSMGARLGLGLAALGRPGYLNVGHGAELGADRSAGALRARDFEVLTFAYEAGVRDFDVARSYGRGEEFLGEWLRAHTPPGVHVSSKWGYVYTAG